MRMWMVDPRLLCLSHLLGEHAELHKHRPSFVKRHSIRGRVEAPGGPQIEPLAMKRRHDELAAELLRRGCRHASPYEMPDLRYLPSAHRDAVVDQRRAAIDLVERCHACAARVAARAIALAK